MRRLRANRLRKELIENVLQYVPGMYHAEVTKAITRVLKERVGYIYSIQDYSSIETLLSSDREILEEAKNDVHHEFRGLLNTMELIKYEYRYDPMDNIRVTGLLELLL